MHNDLSSGARKAELVIHFFVAGTPITQGSKTAFVTRDGKRAVMREGGSTAARGNHIAWRHAVATEARAVARREGLEQPLEGPVSLTLTFALHRPAAAPKKRRTWPIGARSGDLDKLCRAVLDALTGVLIADDSQAVRLVATKDYGLAPGVLVTLEAIVATETVAWAVDASRPRKSVGA